jgi:hypothetical protein
MNFFLTMTDNITFQNIDLSSLMTLYTGSSVLYKPVMLYEIHFYLIQPTSTSYKPRLPFVTNFYPI